MAQQMNEIIAFQNKLILQDVIKNTQVQIAIPNWLQIVLSPS